MTVCWLVLTECIELECTYYTNSRVGSFRENRFLLPNFPQSFCSHVFLIPSLHLQLNIASVAAHSWTLAHLIQNCIALVLSIL